MLDPAAPDASPPPALQPDPIRIARERSGRRAETIAMFWLVLKGYRILARRLKTPRGEIDIVARRGRRLAFVEVKYRDRRDAADASLTTQQAARLHNAAEYYLSRHPRLAAYDRHFDAIFILPRRRPLHLPDALQPVGTSGRRY